jgi:hypothetical protein
MVNFAGIRRLTTKCFLTKKERSGVLRLAKLGRGTSEDHHVLGATFGGIFYEGRSQDARTEVAQNTAVYEEAPVAAAVEQIAAYISYFGVTPGHSSLSCNHGQHFCASGC